MFPFKTAEGQPPKYLLHRGQFIPQKGLKPLLTKKKKQENFSKLLAQMGITSVGRKMKVGSFLKLATLYVQRPVGEVFSFDSPTKQHPDYTLYGGMMLPGEYLRKKMRKLNTQKAASPRRRLR